MLSRCLAAGSRKATRCLAPSHQRSEHCDSLQVGADATRSGNHLTWPPSHTPRFLAPAWLPADAGLDVSGADAAVVRLNAQETRANRLIDAFKSKGKGCHCHDLKPATIKSWKEDRLKAELKARGLDADTGEG